MGTRTKGRTNGKRHGRHGDGEKDRNGRNRNGGKDRNGERQLELAVGCRCRTIDGAPRML